MAGKNFKQKILDLGSEIPKTLEYWRNPTKEEIKFGHGATHFREFDTDKCIDENGDLILAFYASDDHRKYHSCNHEYYITREYKARKVQV